MKTTIRGSGLSRKSNGAFARALLVAGFLFGVFTEAGHAASIDPGTNTSATYKPLNSWSFNDTNNWTSDNGYAPVSFTNLAFSHLGNGASLIADSTNAAWLNYNICEPTNGATNLTLDVGSVMFWFAPGSWSSTNAGGNGPGEWGRLLEVGGYTPDSSYGWWSIYVDDAGSNLYFSAQTNDSSGNTYTLSAPIDWTTNYFHFVTLTYSSTNVALYLDGQLATNDPGGLSVWPGNDVLSNGFYIGSDSNGVLQAHGLFNMLKTYNYPLASNDVQTIFDWNYTYYEISPWNTAMFNIISASSSPSSLPNTYDIITGQGSLQSVGSVTAITSTNVWITNVTANATSGAMAITFTIQGGSDNTPYDVFANSILDFSSDTNKAWAWMGQGCHGNIYTLTNLPNTACFLILGTPQDADSDGITDAYERLVSKTNPYIADTSGDGISDSDEILNGNNPLSYNPGWKLDSDNDGLPDLYESQVNLNPNSAEAAPGLPAYSSNPIQ